MSENFAIGTNVMVFGANPQGRHGAGAALHAVKYCGAVYGQAEGRQGNSYAIITKELRHTHTGVSLDEVKAGVDEFIQYAKDHPEDTFLVTPIGTGLAGFKHEEIAPLFKDAPLNCHMPDVWSEWV